MIKLFLVLFALIAAPAAAVAQCNPAEQQCR